MYIYIYYAIYIMLRLYAHIVMERFHVKLMAIPKHGLIH